MPDHTTDHTHLGSQEVTCVTRTDTWGSIGERCRGGSSAGRGPDGGVEEGECVEGVAVDFRGHLEKSSIMKRCKGREGG